MVEQNPKHATPNQLTAFWVLESMEEILPGQPMHDLMAELLGNVDIVWETAGRHNPEGFCVAMESLIDADGYGRDFELNYQWRRPDDHD